MIVYQETKEQFLLDVYNDKIDEKIEKLAEERGIQIRTLEKQLGFGNKTIKGWKKSSPSLENIAKVAKFFGVTVDYFVER